MNQSEKIIKLENALREVVGLVNWVRLFSYHPTASQEAEKWAEKYKNESWAK